MICSNPSATYDVVVIGGGPAGATAATFLQRQGHRCVVLENSTFPRYHVGESLIPHTYGTLDRLGLLPKLRSSHFPVKHSVRFVSPSGKQTDPFYFSETISGEAAQTWQVERSEFDELCLQHARDNGVEVRMQTRANSVLFDENGRATGVLAKTQGEESEEIHCRVVIDASGRATAIGSQLELKTEVAGLNKASIWGYYRGGKRRPGIDAGETTIFMIPLRGWFWYIPLPDDVVSVGVVASPEYLFAEDRDFEKAFGREVARCGPLQEMLAGATFEGRIRGLRRLAYRNRQIAGDGWVMVGDAAAFLDPIYSSGLFLAMASAELAAGCIHDALRCDDVSAEKLGAFAGPLWEGIEVIRRLIHAFYDPDFSFHKFVERFPEQRAALIDCLVGDVVEKDMSGFLGALAEMTPPPGPV
ncbi:MAG: tryptophan 7-halogenase [Planctomycetes bacterium]|nr:tryptophan 7-halogenase [Planctomycetota bacterium]